MNRPAARPRSLLRRLVVASAVLAVLLGLGAALVGLEAARTMIAVSSDPLGTHIAADVPAPEGAVPAAPVGGVSGMLDRGERVNLLLLGYGGGGHDGANLTDSIMLASIEPKSRVVTLISIPRDLWVAIPNDRYASAHQGKINEAFSIGADHGDRDDGMRLAAATLAPIVGVRIDRTVAVDFAAFKAVVDAIAGIDLTVDQSFVADYPANDDPAVDDSWTKVAFAAGPQHMDGGRTLQFVRARYAPLPEGSDFARAARQQKVILAVRDKVAGDRSAPMLLGLADAFRDHVRTDLSLADIRALADFAQGYEDAKTVHGALTTDNVLREVMLPVAKQSYAYPDAAAIYTLQPRTDGWDEVRAYVRGLLP